LKTPLFASILLDSNQDRFLSQIAVFSQPRRSLKMTIDKSLRVKAGAIQNRNVLTRAERIARLKETERWHEGDSVLGLPKVRVLKLALKKKKKAAKAEEGADGTEGAAPAAGGTAAAAKPAAGAAAKPAAGAAAGKAAAKK
jgi:small basic protein (TIGR04137 family)